MSKMPWFKCKPDPFLSALAEMDADAQHLYTVVILKIYARGGPIRMDARALATFCRRPIRSVQAALDRLVEMGRLTLVDGNISNPVAERELAERESLSEIRAQTGKRGGAASGESRRNSVSNSTSTNVECVAEMQQHHGREKPQRNQESHEAIASVCSSKTKQERSDKDKDKDKGSGAYAPSPSARERKHPWPSDYREQVWALYPKHDEKKDGMAALDQLHKADSLSFETLITGIRRLAATVSEPRFAPALHRWLRKERWNDETHPPHGPGPTRGLSDARPDRSVQDVARALEEWTLEQERDRSPPMLSLVGR